ARITDSVHEANLATIKRQHDEILTQREDLRACAEALENHNNALWAFISQQHYGFNRHETVVSTGGWQACRREPCLTFKGLYDAWSTSPEATSARAALARPGVQAEMKK